LNNDHLLGLVNPSLAFVFSLTFFIFWTRQKSRYDILAVSFAYFAFSNALFITHFAGEWENLTGLIVKLSCFSCGATALLWGIATRSEKRIQIGWIAAIGVLSIFLGVFVTQSSNNVSGQVYVLNVAYGAMFTLGTWSIRDHAGKSGVERLMFWAFVATSLQFFIGPAFIFYLDGTLFAESFRNSYYWAILHVTIALCSLVLALSIIAVFVSDLIQQIRDISGKDLLTGLKTRRAFDDETRSVFTKLNRSPLPVGFVMVDIDHFKQVNDTYGHLVGDAVIKHVSTILRGECREQDIICRFGGEEFVVFLHKADGDKGLLVAERMRMSVEAAPALEDGVKVSVTISIGGSMKARMEDINLTIKAAHAALYRAKRAGRNRTVVDWIGRRPELEERRAS